MSIRSWLNASDVRSSIRALVKNPAFSLSVIGVLTVGIGLNVAVFTMLKSFALSPVAGVEGASRLGVIFGETGRGRVVRVSYPDYQQLRDNNHVFSELFGTCPIAVSMGRGQGARQVWGELVTGNYFRVLGVRAELGRTFQPSDEVAPGRHPYVVISDGLWRRDYGADPGIIGKTVEINNYPLTVVGVTDPSYHGMLVSYDVELFIPVMMASEIGLGQANSTNILTDRRAELLMPHGYLRPGMTLANAAVQTDAAWATLSADRPLTDAAVRLKVAPFWKSPMGGQTYIFPTLVVLSAMGLLVLLIACANIAGLVLARGVARRSEIAVRLALGATRAQIIRLLMVESLVLALPSAALGLLLAWRMIKPLFAFAEHAAAPQRIFLNIQVDGLIVGFALLVACGSALIFGLLPALRTSRVDLVSFIKEDTSSRGAVRGRLRTGLVVAQVAVSLLLLVGAGLMSRSLEAAQSANRGFDESHVIAVSTDLRANGYDEARGRLFYKRLLDAAREEPGIESATLAEVNPMTFLDTRPQRVAIEGYVARRDEDLSFLMNTVGPNYFQTLRINLLAGRAFEDRDNETAAPVAVVNHTLAQRFWGSELKAIGRRVRVGDGDWRTVIGVAADVKYARINESPRPYVYLPSLQSYQPAMILHARGAGPAEALLGKMRARVAAADPGLPILYAKPLSELTRGALIIFQLMAGGLLLFGAAGMALAAMGIYGLVSYTVRQSSYEIGIRMALGAPRTSVVRLFALRGLRLGAIGAAVGIAATLGLSRLLGSLLFGVSATDPAAFAQALALVLGAVVVASVIPALRATRISSLNALLRRQ